MKGKIYGKDNTHLRLSGKALKGYSETAPITITEYEENGQYHYSLSGCFENSWISETDLIELLEALGCDNAESDYEYYCTKSAIEILKRMTPNEIDDYMNMYDELPDDAVIITDGLSTIYIMSAADFQEDSFILDNSLMRIEYFEDGIPDYLLPKRGLTYYYCTWDGQWTFTEDYRK